MCTLSLTVGIGDRQNKMQPRSLIPSSNEFTQDYYYDAACIILKSPIVRAKMTSSERHVRIRVILLPTSPHYHII